MRGKKFDYEYVKDYFEDHDCVLLSTEYIGIFKKLKYICSCGVKSEISFNDFKNGHRCSICGNSEKLTLKHVYDYFKLNGCTLLSTTYINNKENLDYICECGNESKISFNRFKAGSRCKRCKEVKRRQRNENENKWMSLNSLSDYAIYKKVVTRFTNYNYKKHKSIINPSGLKRAKTAYHLDHKFSIYEGFKHKIPPFIIANINNLEMLSEFDNLSKNNQCSITIQTLYSNI